MYSAAKYLVVQVVVQVVAHEEVEQGLLAVLVMLQHGCAVEAQQLAAQHSKAFCCCSAGPFLWRIDTRQPASISGAPAGLCGCQEECQTGQNMNNSPPDL